MKVDVMKFGGSSLKDTPSMESALTRVLEHLEHADGVVVVVSAMGRFPMSYATDTLASLGSHLSPKDKDRLMSMGEVISSLAFLNLCKSHQLNACALSVEQTGILCDDHYQKGHVFTVCTRHLVQALKQHEVVIVPGFTGISLTGNTVTLGRGGSDYSAFLIADALKIQFVSIYTDVNGVYDKDPKEYSDACVYEILSVNDLLSLIDQGAKVMQKESVLFAKKQKIAFEVKNTFTHEKGTLIGK